MKPHEFEALVRAQAIETTQEPIAESAPIPVLKPMNINQLDRQYNALLGESSLREFAGNDLDESVAETTMAGGTEAYTMEDEQLDGMALGELQAIAQAAKKIYASVKQGVPLEAWMYKKITNGNEGLTAVAQQINNPAVREQPGVAEGSLNEFAIDKEPNGDNRSKLIGTIVQLLKSGKKVDFYVPGIRGHVVGSGGNGDWLTLKRWNKPYSKINYSLELDASDDSRFSLKMIKPDYYQVVQSEDMNQGVAEGFPDDILAMAKKVSPNARIRGSRDEEIARRDAMLAQRAQDHANAPEPKGVSANERASLEAELQQLMPKYDRHYQMIDNYTQHMQAKHIADRVHEIQRKLKLGVAEIKDPNDSRWSQKYSKDLPESTDFELAVNQMLNEFAGGMGVSSVAVGPGAMKNPARVGSLFGGSYNPKSPFKKKTKKESIIKR
jgi:hypothetical protein